MLVPVDAVTAELKRKLKSTITPEETAHFATVSADGDREISNISSDGITEVWRVSLQPRTEKH